LFAQFFKSFYPSPKKKQYYILKNIDSINSRYRPRFLFPNWIKNNKVLLHVFYLEIEKEKELQFQLYNTIDQHVEFIVLLNANHYEFSSQGLPRGLYFLNAITIKGPTTMKLLKE
jgi:hypothetical protein